MQLQKYLPEVKGSIHAGGEGGHRWVSCARVMSLAPKVGDEVVGLRNAQFMGRPPAARFRMNIA